MKSDNQPIEDIYESNSTINEYDSDFSYENDLSELRSANDAKNTAGITESNNTKNATQSDVTLKQDAIKKNDSSSNTAGKYIGGRGGSKPWVYINNYPIDEYMLDQLEIDMTGFYPTIFLKFSFKSGVFTTRNFPKDGDLISVFIRSHSNILLPVEVHFLITKVSTLKSKDPEGSELTYFLEGILNVPLLYAEDCYSITNTTSIKALSAICNKLNIGLATNQLETQDEQTWICAWQTNKDFIKSITEHSWAGDSAFFDAWIDWYYKLNFSNMNKQMSAPDNFETKLGLAQYTADNYDHKPTSDIIERDIKHILTNEPSANKSNYYFNSIELISNAGEVNITNGYKRYIHFYEYAFRNAYQNSEDPINDNIEDKVADYHSIIWVDPITTKDSEKTKRLQKGRPKEDFFKNTIKRKWQGIQYYDIDKNYKNVHPYYRLAEFQNFQNNCDIKKMMLSCHLPNCNFNFYRGQVVKIFFTIYNDTERGTSAGNIEDDQTKTGVGIDRFLSGVYTIYGIKIIYKKLARKNTGQIKSDTSPGTFSQQLLLGRREWPMPNSPDNKQIAKDSSERLFPAENK